MTEQFIAPEDISMRERRSNREYAAAVRAAIHELDAADDELKNFFTEQVAVTKLCVEACRDNETAKKAKEAANAALLRSISAAVSPAVQNLISDKALAPLAENPDFHDALLDAITATIEYAASDFAAVWAAAVARNGEYAAAWDEFQLTRPIGKCAPDIAAATFLRFCEDTELARVKAAKVAYEEVWRAALPNMQVAIFDAVNSLSSNNAVVVASREPAFSRAVLLILYSVTERCAPHFVAASNAKNAYNAANAAFNAALNAKYDPANRIKIAAIRERVAAGVSLAASVAADFDADAESAYQRAIAAVRIAEANFSAASKAIQKARTAVEAAVTVDEIKATEATADTASDAADSAWGALERAKDKFENQSRSEIVRVLAALDRMERGADS